MEQRKRATEHAIREGGGGDAPGHSWLWLLNMPLLFLLPRSFSFHFPCFAANLLYRGFSANSCRSHNAYGMAGRSVKLTENLVKPQTTSVGSVVVAVVVAVAVALLWPKHAQPTKGLGGISIECSWHKVALQKKSHIVDGLCGLQVTNMANTIQSKISKMRSEYSKLWD